MFASECGFSIRVSFVAIPALYGNGAQKLKLANWNETLTVMNINNIMQITDTNRRTNSFHQSDRIFTVVFLITSSQIIRVARRWTCYTYWKKLVGSPMFFNAASMTFQFEDYFINFFDFWECQWRGFFPQEQLYFWLIVNSKNDKIFNWTCLRLMQQWIKIWITSRKIRTIIVKNLKISENRLPNNGITLECYHFSSLCTYCMTIG